MASSAVDRDRLQKKKALVPKLVKALFASIRSANELSRQYRREAAAGSDDKSLTYGEICPESFLQILSLAVRNLPIDQRRSFVDLGSGTGKAVISAALSHLGFTRLEGIEIVPGLHSLAVSVHDALSAALLLASEHRAELATVGCDTTPSSKDKRKKDMSIDAAELLQHITDIVHEVGATSTEVIGNKLVQQVGHKVYTAALKKYGKLSKCINQHTERFFVAADGTVSLVTGTGAGGCDVTADNVRLAADSEECLIEETAITVCSSTVRCSSSSTRDSTPLSTAAGMPAEDDDDAVLAPESIENAVKSVLLQHPGSYRYYSPLPEIVLKCGDIFNPCTTDDNNRPWWEEATIAYAASLLFSDDMMVRLLERVRLMTPHSVFISLKPLPLTEHDVLRICLIEESFFKMSWQMALVYIYLVKG